MALDERLNLGWISFRNVIALGHPRLPRTQSKAKRKHRPSQNQIEFTLSRRATARRRLIKTRLQHYTTAAAINILRLGAWWLGPPREQTRLSPFLALAPKAA